MGKDSPEEKIRKIAKEVADAAEPIINDVKDVATPYIEDIRSKAEPVLNIVKEKTAPATKKATDAAKAVGENISQHAARFTAKEEIFVQYGQHEVRTSDILEKAKEDYISKGKKLSDIKEIQIYIKPADNAAYYVVNHSETGKIEAEEWQ